MKQTIRENWNLNSLYAGGVESEKLKDIITRLNLDIKQLYEKIKSFGLPIERSKIPDLLNLFQGIQEVMSDSLEVDEFLICVYSENVEDTKVSNLLAESSKIKAELESLKVELDQLLVRLPEKIWSDLLQQEEVKAYQFYLEERKQHANNKLPLEMEKMINDLSVNGFNGWGNHYDLLMSKLKFFEKDEKEEEISIGQALNQAMFSNDRSQRQKIARSIIKVCEKHADSFASVLNHITGYRLDVYKKRGWQNVLTELLEQNRIKEQTLLTLVSIVKQNKDIIKTFLKRKAQVAKLDKLAWYDILVPSFTTEKKVTYTEAAEIVITQFHSFHEKLGLFAEKAFKEGWIEAENRTDKTHGAFCASMPLSKESRVFLTFGGNYQDVVTLAHELGHAYHNYILHEEPAFSQHKGTSVAETASTFTENLVLDAAIARALNDEQKLSLLEMKITNGLKYLGMVPAMFEFELKLYEERKKGMLTEKEISNLMNEMDNNLYGDIVNEIDYYRWITIPHLYSTEQAFYNIPYTIGFLFSNGIYNLAKEQGTLFPAQYDELLRNSGRMTVEQLAERYLNQTVEEKRFWEASIQPTVDAINEYLLITEKMV
ncbi:oligoendopeptidase F [Peribacillus cavernae]|uniref:Oligoendopeptidase F n=1 Tax=Peribacillus cavernae TaxID=1674310 RepID=A0A433HBQ2_9BACI|nr:M3 family oligoendopeptidase [Peribacillus cavernae]MDQ0220376.1 pepF/M3 family oligoendopeptidase [Peribacillus cavernae]RUQ25535.1 oligoendopeptidase F [Peribacillus cavernae]